MASGEGEEITIAADAVGLLEQIPPLPKGARHAGPDRYVEIHRFLAPLECRIRLLACDAANDLIARQDVADESRELVRDGCRRQIESFADLDELELADEVMLVVLGLEEEPDWHSLQAHGRVRRRVGHASTIAVATPTVRAMMADEIEVVRDLLLAANEENFSAFPPGIAMAYRADVLDVAGRLAFAEVYVAALADLVVGSVTYLPDASDDDHPWPLGGAVLRLLAVEPTARRHGTGERLAICCIERARSGGARFLALHTAPSMKAARRLYERLGFMRTPEYDFDPGAHYGDAPAAPGVEGWGHAYMLRFV